MGFIQRALGLTTVAGGATVYLVSKGGRGDAMPGEAVDAFSKLIRGSNVYHGWANFVAKKASELLEAEQAHRVAILGLAWGFAPLTDMNDTDDDTALETRVLGITFACPIGVSAGFDKHGEALRGLCDMGFGFVEVGGVTPLEQPGNPKPRVFRLREDGAIINRLGLNSVGADVVAERLMDYQLEKYRSLPKELAVGVNVACNTASSDKRCDFATVIGAVADHVDFLVLNISCPNVGSTSRGASASAYQKGGAVRLDVEAAVAARDANERRVPLLVKISPDLDERALEAVAQLALSLKIDGLVVANTTALRDNVDFKSSADLVAQKGGLSGAPLKKRALESTRRLYELTKGQMPIIGVGGIGNAQDAFDRIAAGASLVELYTALAYQGPKLAPTMKADLKRILKENGFNTVNDALGTQTNLNKNYKKNSK